MAKEVTINVDIFKDGTTDVDPSGFTGDECKKATAELEEALGKPITRERKAEADRVKIGDKTKVGN